MNQTIGVNITPQSFQPTLHFSQGDVGRVFIVNVTDYSIPSGATVTCVATKPSGMGFTVSGTVSGNTVTFTSTAEMTDEWGRFPAEIRIASGNTLLGTSNFLMIGEKDPHPASTIDGTQEELIPQLTLLVNRVEAAAESVHDLTVSATTLAAGSDATATYDSTNNSIAFGIPRGADGDVTRSEFNDLKSDLNESVIANMTFEKNGLNNVGTDVTASNRARTQGYVPIPFAPFSIINTNPTMYQINIYWFDYNKTLLGQIGAWSTDTVFNYTNENIAYIRIGVKKSVSGDMTDADITAITNAIHIVQNVSSALASVENNLSTTMPIDYYKHIEDGYVWYIDGTNLPKLLSVNYVASRFEPIFVKKGTILLATGSAQAKLYAFDTDGVTPLYTSDMAWRHDGFGIVATQDCYWYINVALYPTSTTGDIQDAFEDCYIIRPYSAISWQIEDIYDQLKNVGDSYVIGSNLLRKRVNVQAVGKLTRQQSFCIYDGYFYSIDSSGNISKQDSNFNLISSGTISVGHGNSFQLGSNGKAYASGWNDNKIYVVDLETMTVESSITLPTTGYTTGVVDDVNGIAYIFQRSSYPDTETSYNFIVYDYVNENVLSTKKTMPFGALQACDLYEGRIIAVNGLGTQTVPNGYRVYDLDGNVLSNYVIADLATREPEGVAIDRDTGILYISCSSSNIAYKIS